MTGSPKRPIVMLSTEGKTRDEMKAEARLALQALFDTQPDDSEADS